VPTGATLTIAAADGVLSGAAKIDCPFRGSRLSFNYSSNGSTVDLHDLGQDPYGGFSPF